MKKGHKERKKPGLKPGDPRAVDIGRQGGKTLLEARGKDYFAEIGKKGGNSTKEKYGPEFFSQIGRLGVETIRKERGVEFYRSIGRKKKKERGS